MSVKTRKTIPVSEVRDLANRFIKHSFDNSKDERYGIIALVEKVLHNTGNYNGFTYLSSEGMADSENGKSVGIKYGQEDKFEGTDETRRIYL